MATKPDGPGLHRLAASVEASKTVHACAVKLG